MDAQTGRREINFAIGSKHGRRSGKWSIEILRDDLITVTSSSTRRDWAFHWHPKPTHQWHIKLSGSAKAKVGLSEKDSDYYLRSGPSATDQSCVIGLALYVPDSCLRKASNLDRTSKVMAWLPVPGEGNAIEVALIYCEPSEMGFGSEPVCPSRFGPESSLFNWAPMGDRVLAIITRAVVISEAYRERIDSLPRSNVVLDSPERRAHSMVNTTSGAIEILEHAID